MKRFHWYHYVGLGLFQFPPCRYLQRTLLFLCPMQLYGFEDNCFHWTQTSFLSLRIRPSFSWVGLGHNYTESSSSHQCVATFLSFTLQQLLLFAATIYFICCNYFLFAATTFYLQKLYLICSNFILFAETLFNLQQLFYLQHVPCGPPYKSAGAPNDGFLLNALKTLFWLSKVLLDL